MSIGSWATWSRSAASEIQLTRFLPKKPIPHCNERTKDEGPRRGSLKLFANPQRMLTGKGNFDTLP